MTINSMCPNVWTPTAVLAGLQSTIYT